MTRRFVLTTLSLLIGTALLAAVPPNAIAADANVFMNELWNRAVEVLSKKVSPTERLARFRQLFHADFDGPGIARFVLGRYWHSASEEEQQEYLKLFEDYVRKIAPKTVELKFTNMHGGKPWMTSFDNPFVQAASRAIEKGFNKTPVLTREGGSIPVVSTFQEVLGLPSVLFGVGLPDENAHAPNEKLDVANFHGGIISAAYLYDELSRVAVHA